MLGLRESYEYLAANLAPQCSPGAELASGSPADLRRAKAERRAAYLARYWFVVSPLER